MDRNRITIEQAVFTVDEFCFWVRIGRSKFYQEVAAGKLKLHKVGRKSVVLRSDAEEWLNSLPCAGAMES